MALKCLLLVNSVFLFLFVGIPVLHDISSYITELYSARKNRKWEVNMVFIFIVATVIAVLSGVYIVVATFLKDFNLHKETSLQNACSINGCVSIRCLPNNNNTISSFSFYDKKEIRDVCFLSPDIKIGTASFADCTNLKSVELPSNLTEVTDLMFAYCKSLEKISIPKTVTKIGNGAFLHCENLLSITARGDIGINAFADCKRLLSVEIDKNTKDIFEGAFRNCSALEYMIIPNRKVRINIRKSAFDGVENKVEIKFASGKQLSVSDLQEILNTKDLGQFRWLKIQNFSKECNCVYHFAKS